MVGLFESDLLLYIFYHHTFPNAFCPEVPEYRGSGDMRHTGECCVMSLWASCMAEDL